VVELLTGTMETHRRLYNDALGWRIHIYETHGATFTLYEQQKAFARIRKTNPFLARCNAYSLNLTLQRLEKAYQSFFRRCKTGGTPGFPKFRQVGQFNTISFGQNNGYLVTPPPDGERWGTLRLTQMIDGKKHHHNIRCKFHRPLPANAKQKQISITREGNRWFLCISLEIPDEKPTCGKGSVGVDVGISKFATLSDGSELGDSKTLNANLARLRIANRALARKTNKRSNRRKKCREHLAAVHRKIRNTRRNVHENVAKKLVDDFGMIGVENLNVAGMLKNKKLARSIADAGWSQFVTVLESTATRRGAEVVAVPPYNTSQNCSGCGVKVPTSLSMRTHECPARGLELDRDENAAKNILALALEIKKKGKNKKNKKVES